MNDISPLIEDVTAPDFADEPYPGLRSFRRDETHIFFGREGTTNDMVDRLARHRFLAVTGASGSGKSSLVRTGLLDALDRGLLAQAGPDWCVVDFRPGTHPISAMTSALLTAVGGPFTDDERAIIEARISRGPLGLVEWLDEFGLPARTNVLLLVDQFEETFRYRQSDEADAFVALLLASVQQRDRPIYGVITMRSDFLGECSRFPGLAEAINDSQFLAPRLTRAQMRAAIEGPATVYGGRVEPALTTRLLNDMGNNPDQLPLMQHALMLLWQRAQRHEHDGQIRLTVAEYEALGGIATETPAGSATAAASVEGAAEPSRRNHGNGALSDHVDSVLATLTPRQQRLAKILFRALVESEGAIGRDVRRPLPLRDIAAIAECESAEMADVVEAFRAPHRHFLTPARPEPLTPDSVIDISHESLIRQWRTMRDWIREEFQSAETYRHIATSADLWRRRESGRLVMPYLGLALAWKAREQPNAAWASRYGGDFALATRFLESSRRLRQWRSTATVIIVAALFVGVGSFGYYQFRAARSSQRDLVAARDALQQLQELQPLKDTLQRHESRLHDENLADEATDYHVAPQDALRSDVGSNTPLTIPGGTTLLTGDFLPLIDQTPNLILVDAWNSTDDGHLASLPLAVRIPFAGDFGTFTDSTQTRLITRLNNLAGGDKARSLVFFCLGAACWESYNAALRAIHGGFQHVYWYRGGTSSWRAANLDFEDVFDDVDGLQKKLSSNLPLTPRFRWAEAVTLSETTSLMSNTRGMELTRALTAAKLACDQLDRLKETFKDDPEFLADVAASQARLGAVLDKHQDADAAARAYTDAVATRKSVVALDPSNVDHVMAFVNAQIELERVQARQQHYLDAAATLQSAIADWTVVVEKDNSGIDRRGGLAYLQRELVIVLNGAKDYEAALKAAEAAKEIDSARVRAMPDNGQALESLFYDAKQISTLSTSLKRPDQAIASLRDAIGALERQMVRQPNVAAWDADLASAHDLIAEILSSEGKLADALAEDATALAAQTDVVIRGDAGDEKDAIERRNQIAATIGSLSFKLDVAGDFQHALEAADLALTVVPQNWIEANRAHALMFLGRTDEARKIYLQFRGLSMGGGRDWDSEVRRDFADLRKAGHDAPLMAEIEQTMGAPLPTR